MQKSRRLRWRGQMSPVCVVRYVYDDLYGDTYSTLTEIKEEIEILIEDWEDETGETANV